MSLNRMLGGAIALLVLAAAALWSLTHLEIAKVKRAIPPASFVESDPYYALARILSPTLTVKRYTDAADIDLGKAVLVALRGRDLEGAGEARLEKWVRSGGRLLVSFSAAPALPPASFWREGGMFAGLEPRFGRPPKAKPAEPPSPSTSKTDASASRGELAVLIDSKVWFPDARPDKDTSVVLFRNRPAVVVRYWGKGLVLVSGEPLFLMNANLRDDDNLRFTALVVGGLMADKGDEAWLPRPAAAVAGVPHLDAGPILLAAIVAFLIFAWMKIPRFGPVLPEPPADTRSLRARFRAEGRFLWRYGAGVWIARRLRAGGSDAAADADGRGSEGAVPAASAADLPGSEGAVPAASAADPPGSEGAPPADGARVARPAVRLRRLRPPRLSKERFVALVSEQVVATREDRQVRQHVQSRKEQA